MSEKLLPNEKLQLAVNQISLINLQLTHLIGNLQGVPATHNIAKEHVDALSDFSSDAIDLMNSMLDYMNNIDAVTKLDMKLQNNIIKELNK